jgi:hypothetical protein
LAFLRTTGGNRNLKIGIFLMAYLFKTNEGNGYG